MSFIIRQLRKLDLCYFIVADVSICQENYVLLAKILRKLCLLSKIYVAFKWNHHQMLLFSFFLFYYIRLHFMLNSFDFITGNVS